MARKALSDERLDSTAGASPTAASPTDRGGNPSHRQLNQTTAYPAAASRGRQATISAVPLVIFTSGSSLQPPLDADNTQNVSAYISSSSKSSSIPASKETRAAQREGITKSGATVSASTMQPPVHPVTNSPPSRNVLPSRTLRENSSNIFSASSGPPDRKKRGR